MTTSIVQGFTTFDIHAAASLAGDYGTVIFPTGTYISHELVVNHQYQTWLGERGAIIKRSDDTDWPLLLVQAEGLRMKELEFDGNRYVNENLSPGISITNFSLEMKRVYLHSVNHWGLSHANGNLKATDCNFRKTGQAGIFWRITSVGVSRNGPHIERCNFSRQFQEDYVDSGCLIIAGQATKRVIAPRVINNRMICYNPVGREPNNSGGCGILYSSGAVVTGNEVSGGRIGISFGDGDFGSITGNSVSNNPSYGIELAGNSCDNAVAANPISKCGTGVEVSGTSARNKTIGNPNHGCTLAYRDGAGPAYANVFMGN